MTTKEEERIDFRDITGEQDSESEEECFNAQKDIEEDKHPEIIIALPIKGG